MSNEDAFQKISTRIDRELSGISKRSSNQFIFKIHNRLRMTCEAAYEPLMVSIGPYHRGKKNLQKMENPKLECLQGILKRQNESSAWSYIYSLIQYEEQARSYYAEQVSLERDEFVEMLLLDGCFIVEYLRTYAKSRDGHRDSLFKMGWNLEILHRDLLLFENQIPFFILDILFNMTKISDDDQEENLISMAVSCLNDCITVCDTIICESSSSSSSSPPKNVIHLLSLMHEIWCSSFVDGDDDDQNGSNSNSYINFGQLCFGNNTRQQQEEEDQNDIMFIKSASELKQDGIEFVKSEKARSWLDVKFENGEIKIPPLIIQDSKSILRNLIAYEQYMFELGHYEIKCVTDYATFMDCLINKPMDVQELRVNGIVTEWLGDNEEVTDLFKQITDKVFLCPPSFMYRKIFKQVNEHCNKRYNSWISDLKNTYLKNPWKILSLLGAIILLVLTLIQTVFSILQQFKKDPTVVCNCK